jgi:hypothetical protein
MNCPQIRLVRDYITLLTDLGKDWASGLPSDFNRWVPTVYSVQIDFRDYALQLFLNDHNIINYPQSVEDNGKTLQPFKVSTDNRVQLYYYCEGPPYVLIHVFLRISSDRISPQYPLQYSVPMCKASCLSLNGIRVPYLHRIDRQIFFECLCCMWKGLLSTSPKSTRSI